MERKLIRINSNLTKDFVPSKPMMQWCNHSIEIWDCKNSKVWFQFIFHIIRLSSVLLVFKPYFCLACFAMAAYSVACQCNRHQSALAPAQVDYTHFQHLLLRVIRHLWCQLYWLQTDRNTLVYYYLLITQVWTGGAHLTTKFFNNNNNEKTLSWTQSGQV